MLRVNIFISLHIVVDKPLTRGCEGDYIATGS